jgi:hypothetical protein
MSDILHNAIDRLQALHCESVIEPEDYAAVQTVVGELLVSRGNDHLLAVGDETAIRELIAADLKRDGMPQPAPVVREKRAKLNAAQWHLSALFLYLNTLPAGLTTTAQWAEVNANLVGVDRFFEMIGGRV